ncbi:glycosyltransferase WbuB [Sulfurovum sp. TSL6]|uniref:glycosyltransferase family 4 protein n=1 Tax=Sulfurovum sp. TSL6 TaxID=2826995 RepID=UPI001CC41D90|nr:glycosyltransferase family 4 protein [Sulfurovum sp. TSL6]GIU00467.1 glycosyltransferase WbuB [Sulfurovum sp. TSL6]
MKLLFLSDNFPPESNAPASRTFEHCKEWVKEGIEVTVITCNPNFPYGKVYDGYKNKLYQSEIIDSIKVIRVWSYMVENKGALKRIFDYLSYAMSAIIAGLFVKTDLIVATSPQLFTAFAGCVLAKIRRKPWVFELRDLWPEGIKDTGAIKNKKILDFLVKFELCLYRKSDFIITVTKGLKENLVSRGIEASKIDIVTNGANLELFQPKDKNQEILHQLGLEDKFIFGYIGTHGLAHGLEFIVECISEIKDERIHFLFIGTGAKKSVVVALAEKLRLKNVTFLDPVKKNEVADYISVIDVALIPLTKTDIHASLIPSKIFESASMLKPILLGVEGEAKDIVRRHHAGLVFEPENKNEFLESVKKISSNNELYNELKQGCSLLAKEFDRKMLASKMLTILHQVKRV